MAGCEQLISEWLPIPNVAENPEGLEEIRKVLNETFGDEESLVKSSGEADVVEALQNPPDTRGNAGYPVATETGSPDSGQ